MKTAILFTIALILFNSIIALGQKDPLTREDATRILLNEIIVPATLNRTLTAYLVKTPLQPGDQIEAFIGMPVKVINSPSWFAWLNDTPEAFFAHPTRFVFIDQRTGHLEILKGEWWPVLNGNSLFMSEEEMKDLELIIYSDVHRK